MKTYELSFAKINVLSDDVAEVIINNGVEMNSAMVDEYHDFLLLHLKAPFSLLINKVNEYSYGRDALGKIASLKEIKAMAVISYKESTTLTTEFLKSFPREVDWNLEIFNDRDKALAWLE